MDQTCSICLDDINDNEDNNMSKYTTRCNHTYHLECLNDWSKNSDACPLCRRILTEFTEMKYINDIDINIFHHDRFDNNRLNIVIQDSPTFAGITIQTGSAPYGRGIILHPQNISDYDLAINRDNSHTYTLETQGTGAVTIGSGNTTISGNSDGITLSTGNSIARSVSTGVITISAGNSYSPESQLTGNISLSSHSSNPTYTIPDQGSNATFVTQINNQNSPTGYNGNSNRNGNGNSNYFNYVTPFSSNYTLNDASNNSSNGTYTYSYALYPEMESSIPNTINSSRQDDVSYTIDVTTETFSFTTGYSRSQPFYYSE